MDKCVIENAKIESTHLGLEEHGIPTASVRMTLSGGSQGFGGYDLRHPNHSAMPLEIIKVVGVSRWEDLPGKYCRVKRETGFNGRIVAIGHIVDDRWFYPNTKE